MGSVEKILTTMLNEAEKRKAPVFTIGKVVRENPYRSLVFTILSARTRDEATLKASKKLFSKYPTIRKLAKADRRKVEKLIYGVGFYRQKSRNIINTAKMLVQDFNGKVPDNMNDLIKLPGVGRKTANVILSYVFSKDSIAVDTHVHRISNRLGWVKTKKPEETEKALMKIIPKKFWKKLNRSMVSYGQTVCIPRNPKCSGCRIRNYCRYYKNLRIS